MNEDRTSFRTDYSADCSCVIRMMMCQQNSLDTQLMLINITEKLPGSVTGIYHIAFTALIVVNDVSVFLYLPRNDSFYY